MGWEGVLDIGFGGNMGEVFLCFMMEITKFDTFCDWDGLVGGNSTTYTYCTYDESFSYDKHYILDAGIRVS